MHPKRPRASNARSSSSKRRLGGAGGPNSPWASLHEDLVDLIACRVLADDPVDYMSFRAACRQWRSSTASPRGRGVADRRFHPRRWMMLPEGHGLHPGHGKLRGFVRFLNLSTGAFARARLPVFRDHCALGSIDGLLLLQRDGDTAVRLLHPFTADVADFPPLATLLPYARPLVPLRGAERREQAKWEHLRTVRAAAVSVGADGRPTVMMLLEAFATVVFSTAGDERWSLASWHIGGSHAYTPLPFQGKIYMMQRRHSSNHDPEILIFQIDPPQQQQQQQQQEEDGTMTQQSSSPMAMPLPPQLVATFPASSSDFYLAECNSEVLLVASKHGKDFTVFRLADIVAQRAAPVTDIGANSLFLGPRILCVSSKVSPTVASDAIVSIHREGLYLAQYHLGDGTWSMASDGCILGGAIPIPTSIIYHIYTCCFPQDWNKGRIRYQGKMKAKWWQVKGRWRNGA
ncbi:hypothetical protein ACP4OV_008661 [Aristida adscensionis]